jgi:hypothetical protein
MKRATIGVEDLKVLLIIRQQWSALQSSLHLKD